MTRPENRATKEFREAQFEYQNISDYEKLEVLVEGTFQTCWKARHKETKQIVAVKLIRTFCLAQVTQSFKLIQPLSHPNLVQYYSLVAGLGRNRSIYLVREFVLQSLHSALYDIMKTRIPEFEVKCILVQLLLGIAHLHKMNIAHRNIKISHLYMDEKGCVKIGGLESTAQLDNTPQTNSVGSLWYCSPEELLGSTSTSTMIDMWAIGCVFAELMKSKPLFPGGSELDQFQQICRVMGAPDENTWPGCLASINFIFPKNEFTQLHKLNTLFPNSSTNCLDLLQRFLTFDPSKRITAADALKHPYFAENISIPSHGVLLPKSALSRIPVINPVALQALCISFIVNSDFAFDLSILPFHLKETITKLKIISFDEALLPTLNKLRKPKTQKPRHGIDFAVESSTY